MNKQKEYNTSIVGDVEKWSIHCTYSGRKIKVSVTF